MDSTCPPAQVSVCKSQRLVTTFLKDTPMQGIFPVLQTPAAHLDEADHRELDAILEDLTPLFKV